MVVRYDHLHFSYAESRHIGRHMAAARRSAGISLASLARRLKLPEGTLAAYEAGQARFPLRLIFAAGRALRVTPYCLLTGRADRVLNPWGPRLVEWQRVRRSKEPPACRSAAREKVALDEESTAGAGPGQGAVDPSGEAGGSFSILTGGEAERALAFLDGLGPGSRMEETENEEW